MVGWLKPPYKMSVSPQRRSKAQSRIYREKGINTMKVLHIINSFEGGGAEKLTLQLHELSLKQELDSHALSLMQSSAGDLPNTSSLGLKTPYQVSGIFKLYSFLSNPEWQDLDIIHVHLFPAQLIVLFIVKVLGFKAKLITTEHSTSNYRRKLYLGKLLDYIIYHCYERIICISQGTLISLVKWQPQIAHKTLVIHNGIKINDYLYKNYSELENKIPVIISVGRLVKLKNYEKALTALSKISNQNFEYWIVGAGMLEEHLKSLVNTLNLGSKVKFLGFQSNVPQLLHQADIFLQTSLWEGFGLAAVEAMATGLPVVVSDVPGLREVVTDSDSTGFLVDPLFEDDIASKITKLLNDQELRISMGRNARIRATQFDINQTTQEYISIYYSVLKSTLLVPNYN
jgi:glycosyltransferase involved in cell wall biosynthesis